MKKHEFVLEIKSGKVYVLIENSDYLNKNFYCKICNRNVEEMFNVFDFKCTDFGTSWEQEKWLNENIACLTDDEKIIKKLLE